MGPYSTILITSYGQDLKYFFGNNGLLSYRSTKILKDILKNVQLWKALTIIIITHIFANAMFNTF